MFGYYAKWIDHFADNVRPLAKTFPIDRNNDASSSFSSLKQELENAALHSIDGSKAFVVECDVSDIAISATLHQGGRPVAFMLPTLQGSKVQYPAPEKKATAITEAIRKWSHLFKANIYNCNKSTLRGVYMGRSDALNSAKLFRFLHRRHKQVFRPLCLSTGI